MTRKTEHPKRRTRAILCLFLSVILLLPTLGSCRDKKGNETVTKIEISADDLASYKIVRGEDADEDTIAAASKLYSTLNRKYGIRLSFETDYVKKGDAVPVGTKEILIGETNRPESVGVRWSDYRIAVENDRIVIGGGNGKSVAEGVEWFLANCVGENGLSVPTVYATEKTYPLESLKLDGIPLKDYAVAKIVDSGDDETLRTWLGEQVGIRNVSSHEIRLMADATLSVADFTAVMQNGCLILSDSPKMGGFTVLVERMIRLVQETVQAGRTEIVPFGKETMALDSQYKQLTQSDMLALEQSKADRINEIRNTPNMTLPQTATNIYYVSSSDGSDSNNGLSPSTPWKTLAKVNSMDLPSGSYVCLKRGDLWRETLMADKPGVTYTAYGTGEKPMIYGSPVNGADPTLWVETETPNVWKWIGKTLDDVGTMVFNEGASYAVKAVLKVEQTGGVTNYYNATTGDLFNNLQKDLKEDLHFYHDMTTTLVVDGSNYQHTGTGNLYLYSVGNPGERFRSIEFSEYKNLITVKADHITFDNLCIKYTGVHGIATSRTDAQIGLTVTNCELGWIGGSAQKGNLGRNWQTRLGNAIEIYGGCDNFYVKNNYIYQVYDAGITVQANYYNVSSSIRNNLYMKNVSYLDNVIEYCEMPIEDWMSDIEESNPSRFEHVLIKGNQIWYAGYGLCESRPVVDRTWNAGIKNRCSKTGNRAYNYKIKDNWFVIWKYRALQITSNLFNPEDGSDSVAKFSGNTYVGEYGKKFGQVEVVTGTNRDHVDALYNFDVAQYMIDHEDTERGAYLHGHSDEKEPDQFWFTP